MNVRNNKFAQQYNLHAHAKTRARAFVIKYVNYNYKIKYMIYYIPITRNKNVLKVACFVPLGDTPSQFAK